MAPISRRLEVRPLLIVQKRVGGDIGDVERFDRAEGFIRRILVQPPPHLRGVDALRIAHGDHVQNLGIWIKQRQCASANTLPPKLIERVEYFDRVAGTIDGARGLVLGFGKA